MQCQHELTSAVRKELAMALKDLLQHGLIEVTLIQPSLCIQSAENFLPECVK